MTGTPSQNRQNHDWPGAATPYAALRNGDAAGPPASGASVEASGSDTAGDFAAEGEKLKALRDALWAAFEAGPAAGLPNTLIDLTMAYTGALRLQLSLRAVASRQMTPKQKITSGVRLDRAPK